jgi:hypothetical protein
MYNIKTNERYCDTLENWIQYSIETFERHNGQFVYSTTSRETNDL